MGKFLSELEVTLLDDSANSGRGLWKLDKDFMFYSDIVHELIVVPAGFTTDFESVPRVPVFYVLTSDCGHGASTIHDYLYRNKIFTRSQRDNIFYEAAVASGTPKWRAGLSWLGVRLFGWMFTS